MTRDGRTIVWTRSRDVVVWDRRTNRLRYELRGARGFVLDENEKILATGPSSTKVYRLTSGEVVGIKDPRRADRIRSLYPTSRDLTPSGSLLVAWKDGRIELLSRSGKVRTRYSQTGAAHLLHIGEGGDLVFASTTAGQVNIWQSNGDYVTELRGTSTVAKMFDRAGHPFVGVVERPRRAGALTLKIFDVESGEVAHQATFSGASDIDLSCDWSRALVAHADGRVYLWDLTRGAVIHALVGHQAGATSCSFTSDETQALSGGADAWVILWDLPNALGTTK